MTAELQAQIASQEADVAVGSDLALASRFELSHCALPSAGMTRIRF